MKAIMRALPLLAVNWRELLFAVFTGAAGLGAAIALSATAAWLIVRAWHMPPVLTLTVAAVAVRTFGVARPLLRYVERLASHRVALGGMAQLRSEIYRIVSTGRVESVAQIRRGDLLARTSSDVEELGNVVVLSFLPAGVAGVVGIGVVAFLAWLSPPIALTVALCQVAGGLVGPYLTMRGARIAEQARRTAQYELSADALTVLNNATELRVNGQLPRVLERIDSSEKQLTKAADRAAFPAALGAGFDTLMMLAAVAGAIIIGVGQFHAGLLNTEELAVVVLTPLAAFEGIALLGPAAVQVVRSEQAARRIMGLLDDAATPALAARPGENQARPTDQTQDGQGQQNEQHQHMTGLYARDVSLAWPGHEVIAKHLDLTVHPGDFIAIVGPSGVGKSTLLATLAGYIPPAAGTLNGRRHPDRQALAELVAVTAEDAHIFHTTVLENLRVANGTLTAEDARRLLADVGLAAWLEALPDGLDTMLGSDGHTVSGGERRRLLLARALASPAPFLLLDETTEHLDGATADAIVARLAETAARGERGIVLVTHRLSGLERAQEIIMLDAHGGISDRGTHGELLVRNAHYRWSVEQEKVPHE